MLHHRPKGLWPERVTLKLLVASCTQPTPLMQIHVCLHLLTTLFMITFASQELLRQITMAPSLAATTCMLHDDHGMATALKHISQQRQPGHQTMSISRWGQWHQRYMLMHSNCCQLQLSTHVTLISAEQYHRQAKNTEAVDRSRANGIKPPAWVLLCMYNQPLFAGAHQ